MSSCEGCLISGKGQDLALNNAKKAAKEYAVTNGVSVAVYKEGFEYFLCEYAKLPPGCQIVWGCSQYSD